VCESVADLYARDREILGTTERVVVARLMIYLNEHLRYLATNGLVLDQEYERVDQVTKALVGTQPPARKIVPDLILHRRRDTGSLGNLLAIEVKTKVGSNGRLHDFAKLSVLTGHIKFADAYEKCLRRPGDPLPNGQKHRGRVGLPRGMSPYSHGAWLLVTPTQADSESWWWSGGRSPRRHSCNAA
jgi:hypothetical protein